MGKHGDVPWWVTADREPPEVKDNMEASELQRGDWLPQDYVILWTARQDDFMVARISHRDGGLDWRSWHIDQATPLHRSKLPSWATEALRLNPEPS